LPLSEKHYITCDLCPHRCQLSEGETGKCGARKSDGDNIFLEAYGRIGKIEPCAIESQNIFHFSPGVKVLSAGGYGCPLSCDYCNNDISQDDCKYFSASAIAHMAVARKCMGVFMTYNEPCIYYEFLIDLSEKCHDRGLFLGINTNCFVNKKYWEDLLGAVDIFNVDVKGNQQSYVDDGSVDNWSILDNIDALKDSGKHYEISIPVKESIIENKFEYMNTFPHTTPIHLLNIDDNYAKIIFFDNLLRKYGFKHIYTPKRQNTICPECSNNLVNRSKEKLVFYPDITCITCQNIIKQWM